MTTISVDAEPYEFTFEPAKCALVIIDMQRDFLEPGGFGEMLGNDVSQLRRTIEPNRRLLAAWREIGLQVIHTREGHRPDLTDLPPAKKIRGRSATSIGDTGPMGRILIRGEAGHDEFHVAGRIAPSRLGDGVAEERDFFAAFHGDFGVCESGKGREREHV